MSEEPQKNSPEEPTEPTKEEPFDEERAKAKIAKANSEAANLRKRLKEAEAAEAELQKLKDADKSEIERAAEKVKSLEDDASKARQEALRLRIALRKGVDPKRVEAFAKRLTGSSEEELEADADELLEVFNPAESDKGKPPSKPQENLRGGGDPTSEPVETDPDKLAGMISRDF